MINPGKLGEGMTGNQSYVCCSPRPEMDFIELKQTVLAEREDNISWHLTGKCCLFSDVGL
jgi:hypothetical protein